MKKDINIPVVKNISVAVVKEKNELNEDVWNVYLINLSKKTLEQVLVSSKGYITDTKGNETKTPVLRHSLGNLETNSHVLIEPIMPDVFKLHNEYWLSYFQDEQMFDKKYIFLAETISENNFIEIPIIGKKGVMIK